MSPRLMSVPMRGTGHRLHVSTGRLAASEAHNEVTVVRASRKMRSRSRGLATSTPSVCASADVPIGVEARASISAEAASFCMATSTTAEAAFSARRLASAMRASAWARAATKAGSAGASVSADSVGPSGTVVDARADVAGVEGTVSGRPWSDVQSGMLCHTSRGRSPGASPCGGVAAGTAGPAGAGDLPGGT